MLCVLSPAKRLRDFSRPLPVSVQATKPEFLEHTSGIVAMMRGYDSEGLRALMHISEAIARENYHRFQNFDSCAERPALYAFDGDTYRGLAPDEWTPSHLARAQRRMRILSGLYGVLRPLDAIKPYRLEMGLRLAKKWDTAGTPAQWWRERVTRSLAKAVREEGATSLVNLASKEYSAAIDRDGLGAELIEVVFKGQKQGKVQSLGMAVKHARGAMARFILERNVQTIEALQSFSEGGLFAFAPHASSARELHFYRANN